MQREMHWTAHVEGGPRRVNHAAIVHRDFIYSFGGYCSGEDGQDTKPIDVHVLSTGKEVLCSASLCTILKARFDGGT